MKLINRILIALCMSMIFCGQVMAEHSGPYVGAFLGANVLMPAKSSSGSGDFRLTFDPGWQGSAVLGWDFEHGNPIGEGRIELEYNRRYNRLDQAKFSDGSVEGGGKLTADSLLLNFFGVFHNKTVLAPYVGLGLGAARMEASDLQVTGNPMSNDSSVVFAYQLGTGIDLTLTKHLSLDFGYRFFSSIRPEFSDVNGQKFKMDYFSHNAVLGLRLGF